ncbi:MAG: endolytic transglycosylase MltG [Rhodobiaceae bacterium]|nr:endolytic transglycosylase MltG [Rhodobiaceae bacterium]
MPKTLDEELKAGSEPGSRVFPRSPREAIEPEPAPQPPRRKREANPVIEVVNAGLSLVTFLVIVLGVVLYIGKLRIEAPGPLAQTKSVIIKRGDDAGAIAERLENMGVIADPLLFRAGVYFHKAESKLKAGEYLFNANASVSDVISTLVDGKAILHSVTIPEGRTSWEIVQALNAEPLLTGEITQVPPEGSLLPETYKFTRDTDRNDIVARMTAAHDQLVKRVWDRRADGLPLKSPEELVTLASIVEKETGRADERNRVAGVFINRLNKGIRLQSDPTIIYGITHGEGKLGRGLKRSEIDAQTPYNTYQINGLPPTPIANPGRASLEAVANPSRTSDIYFVADGTGGHVFSATLEEHNRNVARWRDIEKQRAAAGDEPSDAAEAASN